MIVRVLKRLRAAVGYRELGMTQHALRCLDSVASMGKVGPFTLVAEVLRNEFLNDRHASAANALEVVACMLPTPARRAVEATLAACYGPSDNGRVANNRAAARGVVSELPLKPAC